MQLEGRLDIFVTDFGKAFASCTERVTRGKLAANRCDKDVCAANQGFAAATGGIDSDSVAVQHTLFHVL